MKNIRISRDASTELGRIRKELRRINTQIKWMKKGLKKENFKSQAQQKRAESELRIYQNALDVKMMKAGKILVDEWLTSDEGGEG